MNGLPVTVRLLDPPLHEFVPQTKEQQLDLAQEMNVPSGSHRRQRSLTGQSSTRCWAIAAAVSATPIPKSPRCRPAPSSRPPWKSSRKQGIPVHVEIMVPLVGNHKELRIQKAIID